MTKSVKPKRDMKDDPLGRTEAEMVADFLEGKGRRPESGWKAVWRKTPREISNEFKMTYQEVLTACRRQVAA